MAGGFGHNQSTWNQTATWVQKDSWLVLKPPPCCLFARHSVLNIAIHFSCAHHYAQPRKRSHIVHVWGARKFLLKVNTSQMSNKKTWPNFPWNTGRFKNQDPYFMAYEIIPIWTWVVFHPHKPKNNHLNVPGNYEMVTCSKCIVYTPQYSPFKRS